MNFPVFDLHCDTAWKLLGDDMQMGGELAKNGLHIDLERAGKLPGYAQCFACFTAPMDLAFDGHAPAGMTPVDMFEREMVVILRELEKHPDQIRLAYRADDVRENLKNGVMSAILTIEGTAGIGHDPMLLQDLHGIGFRMTTLGWNEKNPLCGSHSTGGGLTDLGKDYLLEAERLGMIVDVSHCSDEAFWDIMELAEKPVIASHCNSRAVCGSSRNLTDDMFRAICRSGGVAGMNLYANFIGENATVDMLCDHIFHFMELDPEGRHIALGGDLDGCDELPADFGGIEDYPIIAQRLLQRGLGEDIIRRIYWENALGVMETCCM